MKILLSTLIFLIFSCSKANNDLTTNFAKDFNSHLKKTFETKFSALPKQTQEFSSPKKLLIMQCMLAYVDSEYQKKLPENFIIPKPPHNPAYDNHGKYGYIEFQKSLKKYGIENVDPSKLEIYKFYDDFLSESFDFCFKKNN